VNFTQPLIGITVSKSSGQALPNVPLFALNPLYVEGVVLGGGAPLQIPHGVDRGTLRTIFDRVDGVLLSGGGDVDPAFYDEVASDQSDGIDRQRDEVEMALVCWALDEGKPLFAICRGIQVMNVALGGSLYQDVLAEMPGAIQHAYFQTLGFDREHLAHDVQLVSGSGLASLLGNESLRVNSLHHQGIKALAPELNPTGYAPDGLVEAVEVGGHVFAVGVQWHPEALAPHDPIMRRLFEALVTAARNAPDGRF
jgi:putative glutamine amidotransferase